MSQPISPDVVRMDATGVEFDLHVENIESRLFPVSFVAREAMHEPFRVEIEAIAPRSSGRTPAPHELLGKTASFNLFHDTGVRRFQGVLAEVSIAGERRGWRVYKLVLVSEVWLLGQGRRSRVFQAMTSTEIFLYLLTEAGFDENRVHVTLECERAPRDQTIQHRETNLAFAQRLLAEDGITFFHAWRADDRIVPDEDAGQRISLVVTDQQITYEPTPEAEVIKYRPPSFAGGAGTYVRSFAWNRRAFPSAVRSWMYDYRVAEPPRDSMAIPVILGQDHLDSVPFEDHLDDWAVHVGWVTRDVPTSRGESPVDRARLGLEATKPRDEFAATQLDDAGVRRAIALKAAAITVEGVSDCRHLRHGARIKLEDHPDSELDGSYLVTWVEHRGRQSPPDEPGFSSSDEPPYGNRFGGCPADIPWRPPIRPAPPMESVHLGTVVGPEGEEIHCDPLGRVKVRFLWDASPGLADSASAWVRVMQPWAGNGWGHITIPRVGQEVVVGYVDGNPNEPVVLGTLYNGVNRPPYALPEHKTRFAIKSRSTRSGTDSNEIRFEDKKGSENFYLHASNSMTTAVDGDATRTVGNDDKLMVERDRSVAAENIDIHARNDQKVLVGKSYSLTAAADAKVITPRFTVESKTGAGTIHLEASTSLRLKVGGSEILVEPSRITITSANVQINGTSTIRAHGPDVHAGEGANGFFAEGGEVKAKGQNVTAEATAQAKLKGADVVSEATASNTSTGASVTVRATGETAIHGSMVRLN